MSGAWGLLLAPRQKLNHAINPQVAGRNRRETAVRTAFGQPHGCFVWLKRPAEYGSARKCDACPSLRRDDGRHRVGRWKHDVFP
jgi:hypothetical protein